MGTDYPKLATNPLPMQSSATTTKIAFVICLVTTGWFTVGVLLMMLYVRATGSTGEGEAAIWGMGGACPLMVVGWPLSIFLSSRGLDRSRTRFAFIVWIWSWLLIPLSVALGVPIWRLFAPAHRQVRPSVRAIATRSPRKEAKRTPDREQQEAIQEIWLLDGKVQFDNTSPGRPVIRANLAGTKVTDSGLAHLKGLTQLRSLSLARTTVTDAGLEHLKGLRGLRWLDLRNTRVTDAGLQHLKGLTQLQRLDLLGTGVTDAGAEQLRKALPKCWITVGPYLNPAPVR